MMLDSLFYGGHCFWFLPLRPFKIALIVVVWQNSLSRFCGLSRYGSDLLSLVAPFAIGTDSRTVCNDEATNLSLLKVMITE